MCLKCCNQSRIHVLERQGNWTLLWQQIWATRGPWVLTSGVHFVMTITVAPSPFVSQVRLWNISSSCHPNVSPLVKMSSPVTFVLFDCCSLPLLWGACPSVRQYPSVTFYAVFLLSCTEVVKSEQYKSWWLCFHSVVQFGSVEIRTSMWSYVCT